jgi:hypothetical protein
MGDLGVNMRMILLVSGCFYGVVSYKAAIKLRPLSDLLCVPTPVLIIPESPTIAVWLQQRHPVVVWHVSCPEVTQCC